ncbi:holo-ACP synthase [Streptomyces sp. 8N616]|uniref:holo-ACP synthase n=1 Tax=Streptomyces sp. 8N616 TaxID=3457414 RepID=UPI003FD0BC94
MRIGADLLTVDDLEPVLSRERSLKRAFTAEELRLVDGMAGSRRAEFLTGRYCAKEAVVKLLGTGFVCGAWWHDVEILRHPSGQPVVTLHRRARTIARNLSVTTINVTITHKKALVFAVAAADTGWEGNHGESPSPLAR